MTSDHVTLKVDVPICAFRPYESREYQDTYPFPPPSAVYGMLLSFCGVGYDPRSNSIDRTHKELHVGTELALAMEGEPERASVFRKLRRGKLPKKKYPEHSAAARGLMSMRPDCQDLLVGVRLWVWLGYGDDAAEMKLVDKVLTALNSPEQIDRSGGLSLGESSYLVDSITQASPEDSQILHFLKPDGEGFYSLPVWVDHGNDSRNRPRFSIVELPASEGASTCSIAVKPTE